METNKGKEFAAELKTYLNLQVEILRLDMVAKISGPGGSFIASAIIALFALVALMFLSVAAGFYLSTIWSSYVLGFSVVGGCYLLLSIFLILFREKCLAQPIGNKIVKELLKDKTS